MDIQPYDNLIGLGMSEKRTYTHLKDYTSDMSYENEIKYDG